MTYFKFWKHWIRKMMCVIMRIYASSLSIILWKKSKRIGSSLKMHWNMPKCIKNCQHRYTSHSGENYILESRNFEIPPPLKKPSHMVIVDDCQGPEMYTMAWRDLMNHVTIKHRHFPITICYLMQSGMGFPRTVRLNATHFIIYRTGNLKQIKQIYENLQPMSPLKNS